MTDGNQLSFGDGLLSNRRKISNLSKHLAKLDQIIDWQPLIREISIIDKTDAKTGGRPRKNPLWMTKATFLQSLFSLSDPQLEAKDLMVKKGTVVDASILPSSGRPLSDKKRWELVEDFFPQIDTDVKSTKKGGTYYFEYKGHIGVDV